MKVGLAQFNPTVGAFSQNTARIIETIERAKSLGVNLLVFPELSIAGYPPRDFLDFPSFVQSNRESLDRILVRSLGITTIVGYVEENPSPTGRGLFNSAAVISDGRMLTSYRKQLLPHYDIFDEERFFEPGTLPSIFKLEKNRIGITICEDAWNFTPFLHRPYKFQPLTPLVGQVDLLLNLSASPFSLGKPSQRMDLFRLASGYVGSPVAFCNQVGGNDELIFDGGSFVMSRQGEVKASAPVFEEALLCFELEGFAEKRSLEHSWPFTAPEWIAKALCLGIRDYLAKCGAEAVCIGLSGGIDSAVCASLACHALGKENVIVVFLPSQFTSDASKEDVLLISRALGIELIEMSIDPFISLYEKELANLLGRAPRGHTNENIQARIRMSLLMALSNDRGSLLLNTSNKSEIATGYATLYGDSAGALSVLGDLTKKQVYEVAHYLNQGTPNIPQRVLERAPSAELKPDQTDQDTLPPYDVLDALVSLSTERRMGHKDFLREGYSPRWVDRFQKMHSASEFKRKQLPPVLRVSSKAFGMGRRMPIASVRDF